jgi:FkbM family methyltransferase
MPTVRGIAARLRHPLRWARGDLWDTSATRALRLFARLYPEAFVIEIGANDGVFHDPLWEYLHDSDWRALLVEPQPEVFERLLRNYEAAADRVVCENVAIAAEDGPVTFYNVEWVEADGGVDRWDPIGTTSAVAAATSAAHFIPEENRRVVETEVAGLTLESLRRRHGIDGADLVMIDTEGRDLEIVRQLFGGPLRPRLLGYEHLYFSPAEVAEARELAERNGYATLIEGRDTWCLDPRPQDALTRLWRDLRPGGEPEMFYAG